MKFYVHRDPNNKLQMIPYVALQMSKLANASRSAWWTAVSSTRTPPSILKGTLMS